MPPRAGCATSAPVLLRLLLASRDPLTEPTCTTA